MAQKEIHHLQRELGRVRRHLNRLEQDVFEAQNKLLRQPDEKKRLEKLAKELERRYPKITPDMKLLSLVGVLPKIPRSKERESLIEAIAEKYGK